MSGKAVLSGIVLLLLVVGAILTAVFVPKEVAVSAVTDPILTIHEDSLTTYLVGATPIQKVLPLVTQRGVGIDGASRGSPGLPFAIAGNPFEGADRANGVREATGNYEIADVDSDLPTQGLSWKIGRTWNGAQASASDGYQGYNWFQTSQPELVFEDGIIYLVHGAAQFGEYLQTGEESTCYKGVNGTAGIIEYVAGDPDVYYLTDQHGTVFAFWGADYPSHAELEGQLWTITDTAGNVTYVGHTSWTFAAAQGYENGRIFKVFTAGGNHLRYTYDYSTVNGSEHLTEVKVEQKNGANWDEKQRITYGYYTATESGKGLAGDLKTVTILTALSDSGTTLGSGVYAEEMKYYRYYTGNWADSDYNRGVAHQLKMIVDFEGARRFDYQDSDFDTTELDNASDPTLLPYTSVFLEYPSGGNKVAKAILQGCGCGSSDGEMIYTYETNADYNPATDGIDGYTNFWASRTVVQGPEGRWDVFYADEVGARLSHIVADGNPADESPPDYWVTQVIRNGDGQIVEIATPAANATYDHDDGDDDIGQDTTGLIHVFTRSTGGDAFDGFRVDQKYKIGSGGTAYMVETITYDDGIAREVCEGDYVVRPVIASRKIFNEPGKTAAGVGDGSVTWSYAYEGHHENDDPGDPPTLAIAKITTTEPAVTTANNGSDSSNTTGQAFNKDGTLGFSKDQAGIIEYREYTYGLVTKLIEDADTAGSDFTDPNPDIDIPSGFSSSGTEFNRRTTYTYDSIGRVTNTLPADGRELVRYYTRLLDRRLVALGYADKVSTTYYGPVSYRVTNHAGRAEATAALKFTSGAAIDINEGTADAVDAAPDNTVTNLRVSLYSESGTQVESTNAYHLTSATLPGSENTNYDVVATYTYDAAGRQIAVEDATGTIRETAYDIRGNVTSRSIGTDNSGGGGDNMVATVVYTIDGGSAGGNGYITSMMEFVTDSSTGARTTDYTNDAWGSVLLETRESSYPKKLTKFDNRRRATATGVYSSGSSPAGDPVSVTSGRLALTVTTYDELDRAFKTTKHKIDDGDGSSDDTLIYSSWFDSRGRLIKTDGQQLLKYAYDRLNRQTNEFILSHDNDSTTYANMEGVSGDILLQESQTIYANPATHDGPLAEVTYDRPHSDTSTTGALNTEADGDLLLITAANCVGRPQITFHWYDDLVRLVDTVEYGNNGGSNLDRDGASAPSRSLTAHRTTYAFDSAGRVNSVTDPRAKVEFTTYDDQGRQTAVIRNFLDGTPNNPDGDEKTTYTYDNGLVEQVVKDLPAGSTDQTTTYTYGTTKGSNPNSRIATGHLLSLITYPDSTGAGDDVKLAYNAQEELVYRRDQAANVLEYSFDEAGRATKTEATTISGGFDSYVDRMETAYTSLSQVLTLTQKSGATVRDEVKYTYDDWGNVTRTDEDHDSAVDGNAYVVQFTYDKATTGRNTASRLASMTYPNGNILVYNYSATIDANSSRVSSVQVSGGAVNAIYTYLGLERVVKTYYDEPDVFSSLYNLGNNAYDNLGRFNEKISCQWTKDLGTDRDFYDVDYTYDENLNVTAVNDLIHGGLDQIFTIDGRDRVSQTEYGTWAAGPPATIGTDTRNEVLVRENVGRVSRFKLDLEGDMDFTAAGERDSTKTYSTSDEMLTRNTDSAGGVEYTLQWNAVRSMSDDGKLYTYVYDVFGRLMTGKNRTNGSTIVAYRYDALGNQITRAEAGSSQYHYVYDLQGRRISTYRSTDANPKENFRMHQSGFGDEPGQNMVIARHKDATTAWGSQADALDQLFYYCYNSSSLSVIVRNQNDATQGQLVQWIKYTTYGLPIGIPPCDPNTSFSVTAADETIRAGLGGAWLATCDPNLDGAVNGNDQTIFAYHIGVGTTLGWGVPTTTAVGNDIAYQGWRWDGAIDQKYFAGAMCYSAETGVFCTEGDVIELPPFRHEVGDDGRYTSGPNKGLCPQPGYRPAPWAWDPLGCKWVKFERERDPCEENPSLPECRCDEARLAQCNHGCEEQRAKSLETTFAQIEAEALEQLKELFRPWAKEAIKEIATVPATGAGGSAGGAKAGGYGLIAGGVEWLVEAAIDAPAEEMEAIRSRRERRKREAYCNAAERSAECQMGCTQKHCPEKLREVEVNMFRMTRKACAGLYYEHPHYGPGPGVNRPSR